MPLNWEPQEDFEKHVVPIRDPWHKMTRIIGLHLTIENLEMLFRERERFGEALSNLRNAGFGGDPKMGQWGHSFTRLFALIRSLWQKLEPRSLLICYGTADGGGHFLGAPQQAYLAGFG